MRKLWLIALLGASLASAQQKPAASNPEAPKASPPAVTTVAPDAPVLTIKGLCPSQQVRALSSQLCETVVTREQFEKLVIAIQPSLDARTKQQIGRAYPDFLIMANEAHQRGLDKTDRVEERLAFARLQILSQELVRQIQEQAAQVPDKDIEAYYQKTSQNFELVNLQRIVIPLQGENGKASPDAMKKEAEALRARAAAGEDFSQLQKDAYGAAGVRDITQPNPNVPNLRRRSLPLTQVSAFDMKPGEVSPVIRDVTGYYIYKMDSKGMMPLKEARREIENILRQQRASQMIESVHQPFTTEVNRAYFGEETEAGRD